MASGSSPSENMEDASSETRIWKRPRSWIVSVDFLQNRTPSRLHEEPLTYEEENAWTQHLCGLIEELGMKVEVTHLVNSTAIVYLRRVFTFLPLQWFNKSQPMLQVLAAVCLFLAAKVEEKPRKLEHVVGWKVKLCGSHLPPRHDKHLHDRLQEKLQSREYTEGADDYKRLEAIVLKVLGFGLTIDHPHTHVVKACHRFQACPDFAQTAYFMATCSLQLTNMCMLYSAVEVAAACIHIALKWSRNPTFPKENGLEWFQVMDPNLTKERLESIANVLIKAFRENQPVVQKILQPQRYKEEFGRSRVHHVGLYTRDMQLNSYTAAGPSRSESSSQPGPSLGRPSASSTHSRPSHGEPQPGPSHTRTSHGEPQPGPSHTRPSHGDPQPGPSHTRTSHGDPQPGPSHTRTSHGDPQPGPSRTRTSHEDPQQRSGMAPMHPEHAHLNRHRQRPAVSQSERHPYQRRGDQRDGSSSSTAGVTAGASRSRSTPVDAASHPATVSHHSKLAGGQGRPGEPLSAQPSASRGASAPVTKKLSLQDYQQRAELRPPPPPQPQPQPQAKADESPYPMYPGASKSHPHPTLAKPVHGRHPYARDEHKKPLAAGHAVKEVKPSEGSLYSMEHPAHRPEQAVAPEVSHGRYKLIPLEKPQAGSQAERGAAEVGRTSRSQKSPVKPLKKEGGGLSSVSNDMHLKEIKVMVQDLKDSQGKEKALYNTAEASRKRSLSQSLEDDGDASRPMLKVPRKLNQEDAQYNHSMDPTQHKNQPPSEDVRKMGAASRHKSPVAEGSGSFNPIKLHIYKDSGRLQVKNSEGSSPISPAKSSALKMKIRRTPEVGAMHSAIVSSDSEESLKMRLAMPGSTSGQAHERLSQAGKAEALPEGHHHQRKQKHGGAYSQAHKGGQHHASARQGGRSSTPQVILPTQSGDGGNSHLQKTHPRPRELQPETSGFTFSDSLISTDLPAMIFDQEPQAENGGYGPPETPTPENMHQVSLHMGHLLHQAQQNVVNPAYMSNDMRMFMPTQPPLPPPLPDNPPPPPPPPPQ